MNRLQLATLMWWGGDEGIQGRKRLQKVVFFLQQAGCSLDCHYTLHYFGPYSRDVADACDEMVAAGLVIETGGPRNGVMQYDYTLKPEIRILVEESPDAQLRQYQTLGKELIRGEIWPLELGSTILYFYRESRDWSQALSRACEFKKVPPDIPASKAALQLAQRVEAYVQHQ